MFYVGHIILACETKSKKSLKTFWTIVSLRLFTSTLDLSIRSPLHSNILTSTKFCKELFKIRIEKIFQKRKENK